MERFFEIGWRVKDFFPKIHVFSLVCWTCISNRNSEEEANKENSVHDSNPFIVEDLGKAKQFDLHEKRKTHKQFLLTLKHEIVIRSLYSLKNIPRK